jgi:hypothetical protein
VDTVQLSIAFDSPAITTASLGTILVAGKNVAFTERTRVYTSAAALLADTDAAIVITDYEYKALADLFAQNPTVPSVKVGRCDTTFVAQVQTYKITTNGDGDYGISISSGLMDESINYPSSGSETVTQIRDGLLAALNAGEMDSDGLITFATQSTDEITATADTAGFGFSSTATGTPGSSNITVTPTTPSTGWQEELAAVAVEDDDWHFLVIQDRSDALIGDAAAYASANVKLLIAQSSDADGLVGSPTYDDVLTRLQTKNYKRVATMWYSADAEECAEAWCGKSAATDPDEGSTTWAHKNLTGITADDLDDITLAEQAIVEGKNGNVYVPYGGVGATWEGKVADGTYVDTMVTVDWIYYRIIEDLQTLFLNASNRGSKIPYTDAGIQQVAGVIRKRLEIGADVRLGHLDPNPTTRSVTAPNRADVSAADVTARIVRISFQAQLAGAIHKTIVTGAVVTTFS